MIIAFDGNVFAGKTTLINHISKGIKCQIIPEHTLFIKMISKKTKSTHEFRDHLKYLKVDDLRLKNINQRIILLDRSFVSLSAHIYALYISTSIDLREKHLMFLYKLLGQKKIIIPDKYIFVICDRFTAQKRYLVDKRDPKSRKTPSLFVQKKYFQAIEKFNLLWQNKLLHSHIITCNKRNYKRCTEKIALPSSNKNKKLSPKDIYYITYKIFFNN